MESLVVNSVEFDDEFVRHVPGWDDAPVPPCFGGDPRGLAFCCDPRYPLAYEFKCQRARLLEEIGITEEEHIRIKQLFSKEHDWDDERVCFKSLSFCCLRRHGCPNRDPVIAEKCGSMEEYYRKKRLLALKILKMARNKEKVQPYIEHEEAVLRELGLIE